jgi:hypothetical protein
MHHLNRYPMILKRFLFLLLAMLLLTGVAARAQDASLPWSTPEAIKQYYEEMRAFFKGAEVRFPGSDGNLKIEEKVAQTFAATKFEHGAVKFVAPVFKPGKSVVDVNGASYALQTLHPTLMRPGNFKENVFRAPLVYLGRGRVEELAAAKGVKFDGAIAVLDFNCDPNWSRLLRFGIKGFIFVPNGPIESIDAQTKVYDTETATPRFYVSEEDGKQLVAAIKLSRDPLEASFNCEPSVWSNMYLRDPWVLVPGADATLKNEVCVIIAPIDSNAIVPERAEGGQAGANLFLLMQMLKSFEKTPPARSVLLVAINAHTQFHLGERVLATHLCAPMKDIETLRDYTLQDMRLEDMFAGHYRKLSGLLDTAIATPGDAAAQQAVEDFLVTMRTEIDTSTGKQLPIKKALLNKLEPATNHAKSDEADAAGTPALAEKTKNYKQLLDLEMLLNKFGRTRKFAELTADETRLLSDYVKRVLDEEETKAKLNKAELDLSEANNAVRTALQSRTLPWVLSLAMTWRGKTLGLSSGTAWGNPDWRNKFGAELVKMAGELPGVKAGREDKFVDTMTFKGGLPEGYFFSNPGNLVAFQGCDKTPAFSLQDVFSFGERVFTPDDRFDRLDPAAVGSQAAYCDELLRGIIGADTAGLTKANVRQSWPLQIKTMQFDRFSSSVLPEIDVANSFVVMRVWATPLILDDVVQAYTQLTDMRATAKIYGVNNYTVHVINNAFQMDQTYREVQKVVDGGDKEASLSSAFSMSTTSQTFVMCPCREYPILTRDDPSLISVYPITLMGYKPLDGRRESPPQERGASGVILAGSDKLYAATLGTSYPASLYVGAFTPTLKILSSIPALNATKDQPEGLGYASSAEIGPDFFAAATKDLDVLNRYRLGRLKGVSIELASDFLNKGRAQLDEAAKHREAHDYIAYLQAQHTALGAERQSYYQLASITNDMLRGVLFYMALILPFCFFMQKLLFNFVKIEAQIAAFFVLFVAAYILFREIHPAFAIAKAPEGILIAFVMGGLATFVVKILHGRFEGEMALLFQNFAGNDAADVGYGTVGQKAMLIGVNNMRRRRVRTLLTTATIVLITFTMLSFTSISQTMSPTVVSISKDPPPYTGIMYHWPGKRMDEATLSAFREMFYGKGEINVRRWMLPAQYDRMALPYVAEGANHQTVRVESVLGLSKMEDGFLGRVPLLEGRYFSSDEADEALIPNSMAEVLGITRATLGTPEARVHFRDADLTIVGILDDESFRRLKDIDGYLLLPQKEGMTDPQAAPGEGSSQGAGSKDQSGLYNDTSSMMVLPVNRCARMGATPYSISIRFGKDNDGIWTNVLHLLTQTQANFYIASQAAFKAKSDQPEREDAPKSEAQIMSAGVYYIGSGFKTSVGNLASLIIPLLISGTIILNTMLGSVFERKKEIAIYNAIGLNPNHIGMFFLSEAFVYGIVGSVGGYLIGQVMSIALIKLGVTGIDLNFASLKVIYVILFTIAMVLLSTLYPAMVATRAAVPSGKRKWAFPEHDGNTMTIVFPFIYQPQVVGGVMGYLEEYFARFTEASMGDLIASNAARGKEKDEKGRETYWLAYDLALAPFDLGVTQRVTFRAAYNERVQSYGIQLTTVRISGQDTNWMTTNKPFLERLRTYLMHWRSLSTQEQAAYAQAIEQLLKEPAGVAASAAAVSQA